MANDSTINSTSAGGHDDPQIRHVKSIEGWDQDLEELTPLQRQRLDTAIMMLVNYLVSASSPNTKAIGLTANERMNSML